MAENRSTADNTKRWFTQGQRVRVAGSNQVGIVQATFPDGMHYVRIEGENHLTALPGNMLMLIAVDDPPA